MKRGNFSLIALGVSFLLFMVFVLFYKPSLTSSVTGYFVFNADEVIVTNVSVPINGNFAFNVEDKEGDIRGILNITNSSLVRMALVNLSGRIAPDEDRWLTFEEIATKTTPVIEFDSYGNYKIPKIGAYRVGASLFGITPHTNGTFKLILDIWYNATKRKEDSHFEKTVLVNYSAPVQPPGEIKGAINITAVLIKAYEIDKDGNIIKNRTTIRYGDLVVCSVNFSNSTKLTAKFKFFKKSDDTTEMKSVDGSCINKTCEGKYVVDKAALEDWRCKAELLQADGNSIYDYSSYIRMINSPPVLIDEIPDIYLEDEGLYDFSLTNYFSDPDGDALSHDMWGVVHGFVNITDSRVFIEGSPSYMGSDVVFFRAMDKYSYTDSNNVTIYYNITGVAVDGCVPDWKCTEFSGCVNAVRTRECSDENSCNATAGKPVEKQTCVEEAGAEEEKPRAAPLTPLQKEEDNTLIYVIIIIFVVLGMVAGGGAFYYFKYVKKANEEGDKNKEGVPVEKKTEEVVGGVTGESTLYKPAVATVAQAKPAEQPAAEIKPAEVKVTNIDEIYKYFEQAQDLGKAKEELLTAGWDKKDVQRAFDVVTLKRYVADKVKAGFDREKIKESLKAKGWKQDIIDDVFK